MAATVPSLIQRRIVVAAGICVMAFALIGLRLIDLAMFKGRVTGASVVAVDDAPPMRADIVDRNGELLARDLPVFDLYATPHTFWDKEEAARDLASATGANLARLEKAFASKHSYVLIARQISPDVRDRVMHLGLPGLEFHPAVKRFYPQGIAAVQVIGATEAVSGGRGVDGLERGLNARLASGSSAQLSLDMRVQYVLESQVDAARKKYGALAAGGIVMNVNTGEVLAMASLPDTPEDAQKGIDPRRNRMAQDDYELGSVFKIFSFALALEDHTTRMDELLPVGSGFKIDKYTIRDAERMPALMKARDILAQSSNAGTAQIALRSGPDRQRAFLASLGLLEAPHSELAEWSRPILPRHWGQVETATIGFGHGISVSPLAFVTAASIVVNGGRRITPTFLKQDGDRRGEQVIKPATSAGMRELLRYVVTDGTGKSADVLGYNVGGKTGSAEKNEHGRYVAHKLLTSFCAAFPIDNPRYLVFVMLDEPHGANAEGVMALAGHTAAPLAGDVIAHIAPMLEMPAAVVVPHAPTKSNS